jgi:hypothetical protein
LTTLPVSLVIYNKDLKLPWDFIILKKHNSCQAPVAMSIILATEGQRSGGSWFEASPASSLRNRISRKPITKKGWCRPRVLAPVLQKQKKKNPKNSGNEIQTLAFY